MTAASVDGSRAPRLSAAPPVQAWSRPHTIISQVACELLPAWQQQILANESEMFAKRYCLYPDNAGDEDAKPARDA